MLASRRWMSSRWVLSIGSQSPTSASTSISGARRLMARIVSATCCAPPSGRSSRSTIVSTTYLRPIATLASATFSGSSWSTGTPWPCVLTAQNRQPRVQVSPSTMNVAVPPSQHSPMLGHRASSQTVCRPRSRRVLVRRATVGPEGIGTFSHEGFCPGRMRLLWIEDMEGAARRRSKFVFGPAK